MTNQLKTQSAKRKVTAKNSKFLILGFNFAVFALRFTLVFAQPVSSSELINNARVYDGKNVVYEGEAVGEIMERAEFAWINLNDGENAIGIWAPKSLFKEITYTGSYESKGDWVEITGIFHRACIEHGGDLDIHAQALRKTGSGKTLRERINIGKRNMVFVLAGVLCLVWILKQSRQA
ncbi:MAG: DNA-binding protein [Deltaproteobacteria bacterium]